MINNTDPRKLAELAGKYVCGTATASEIEQISKILSLGGDTRLRFEKEIQSRQAAQSMDSELQQSFSSVVTRIQRRKRQIRAKRIRIGAACACAAAVCFVLFLSFPHKSSPESIRYSVVEAMNGGQLGVVLPDGSTARLTPGSKIIYGSDFSAGNRRIALKGEGYFDIVSDRKHPFEIAVGECKVKVLGTKFNLSAPEGGEEFSLTLVKGSVHFESPDAKPVVMVPGDCLHYLTSTESISLNRVDLDLFKEWMEGDIEFMDKTIPQIARSLSMLYGKDISIGDALAGSSNRYTVRLVNRESLDDVMLAMETLLPVRFTRAQGKILIEKK